jgi:deoxycytidine triphosphate deaminase
MATETKPVEKKKTVKIKLPLTRTEKDDVYVAVNGKSYLIKRGETVEVPESVAEVLQHKEEMLAQAMAFEAQASANADQ